MNELDHLLGAFVDARLASLSDDDLGRLEALLDVPDQELYRWLVGADPAPPIHQSALLAAMIAFHRQT